jgi:hypothetical protein
MGHVNELIQCSGTSKACNYGSLAFASREADEAFTLRAESNFLKGAN